LVVSNRPTHVWQPPTNPPQESQDHLTANQESQDLLGLISYTTEITQKYIKSQKTKCVQIFKFMKRISGIYFEYSLERASVYDTMK